MLSDLSSKYSEYIEKKYSFRVTAGQKPERLDVFLTRSVQNASRTKVIKAIESGNVTINGIIPKCSRKIKAGDIIECRIMKPPPLELVPEDISLNIIYEDEYLLVVNKPAGMVTHPGYSNNCGTLVNAILFHLGYRENIKISTTDDNETEAGGMDEIEELSQENDEWPMESGEWRIENEREEGRIYASELVRPGIVHRLDKDTSGLLVIAKNDDVHRKLSRQFFDRTIDREYRALVWGSFTERKGRIDANIGRSPKNRKLFSIVKNDGKRAITDYEVLEEFFIRDRTRTGVQPIILTLLKIKLGTGRTHQIRVHLSGIGHPIFGDIDYNGGLEYIKKFQAYKNINLSKYRNHISSLEPESQSRENVVYNQETSITEHIAKDGVQLIEECVKLSGRLLLDAVLLGFMHPVFDEKKLFRKDIEKDMNIVINLLRNQQQNDYV